MKHQDVWQWHGDSEQHSTRDLVVGSMFCIGKNYADHIAEMGDAVPGDPVVFLKPPCAYAPSGAQVRIPSISQNMHHEVEAVVVVGSPMVDVAPEQVWEHVVGYGVGIDFTLRDVQRKAKDMGLPWTVAKSFRHSGPVSPLIPTDGQPIDTSLEISCTVNGTEKQRSTIDHMQRTIPELLSYLSQLFELRPGDCVFTGTPAGVSQVVAGDRIAAKCSGGVELEVDVV